MSEDRKTLSLGLLVGELIGGIAFGLAVGAYCWSMPATVNRGISITAAVVSRLLFYALVVVVLNRGLRSRSLILIAGAGVLFLILILTSFPQY